MSQTPPPLTHAMLPAKGPERGVVVLLHGLGADEDDILGLALDLPRDLRYLAVRAPYALPWGGYAWYPMLETPAPLEPAARPEEAAAFRRSADALCAWLAALASAEGTPPTRTVLAGFSQGAAMTAAVLCRADAPSLAGYGLLSGYLHPAAPAPGALDGRRVFIGHGEQDPLLAPAFGAAARDRLAAAGARVVHRRYPAAHTICPAEVADIRQWLGEALPAPAPPG